jgi:hypothetical protein
VYFKFDGIFIDIVLNVSDYIFQKYDK